MSESGDREFARMAFALTAISLVAILVAVGFVLWRG